MDERRVTRGAKVGTAALAILVAVAQLASSAHFLTHVHATHSCDGSLVEAPAVAPDRAPAPQTIRGAHAARGVDDGHCPFAPLADGSTIASSSWTMLPTTQLSAPRRADLVSAFTPAAGSRHRIAPKTSPPLG